MQSGLQSGLLISLRSGLQDSTNDGVGTDGVGEHNIDCMVRSGLQSGLVQAGWAQSGLVQGCLQTDVQNGLQNNLQSDLQRGLVQSGLVQGGLVQSCFQSELQNGLQSSLQSGLQDSIDDYGIGTDSVGEDNVDTVVRGGLQNGLVQSGLVQNGLVQSGLQNGLQCGLQSSLPSGLQDCIDDGSASDDSMAHSGLQSGLSGMGACAAETCISIASNVVLGCGDFGMGGMGMSDMADGTLDIVRAQNVCARHRRSLAQMQCFFAWLSLWMEYELSMVSEGITDLIEFTAAFAEHMSDGESCPMARMDVALDAAMYEFQIYHELRGDSEPIGSFEVYGG